MNNLAGISETNRRKLTLLHRHTRGLVGIDDAATILNMDRTPSAKLLARLASQGWARRIRRGLYLLIPLDATSPDDWREDPWILAHHLFEPAYIAGWSACEYWGFTEQIFHHVAVFTATPIRDRRVRIDGTEFILRAIPEARFFGTHSVWRQNTPVKISDPTHTIVDILDVPEWGGGIRHVVQMLTAYITSEHYDEELLVDYLARIGNYAASKRLGYLLETIGVGSSPLINRLHSMRSEGYALLDPGASPKGHYVARWHIRVNVERLE